MPEFEFEVGGNVYKIDAPDQSSALSKLQAARGATPTPAMPPGPSTAAQGGAQPGGPVPPMLGGAQTQPEPLGAVEKVRRGLAASGIKGGLALGELVEQAPLPKLAKALGWGGFMPDEEHQKRIIEEINADVKEGGLVSGAAELAGDIGASAIPGAKAYTGIRGLVGSARPILGRTLAAMGSGGGTAAALTPGGVEERGMAGAAGAAGGLVGEVGGAVLEKTLRPVKPSPSAEKLMAEGVVPTVGRGAQSKGFKMLEDIVAHVPFAGGVVRKGQERALSEFREAAIEKILGKEHAATFLKSAKEKGLKDREVVDALNDYVWEKFGANTPHDRRVRELWGTYQQAASELGETVVTPRTLQAASRSVGGREAYSGGKAPLQDIADPAQILTKSGTGVLPTMAGYGAAGLPFVHWATSIPAVAATAGATRMGARLAMGDYAWQKAIRDALRKSSIPALTGAAAAREIEED